MIDLDKLEALARAATAGPWLHRHDPGNPAGCQYGVKLPGELGAWIADCIDNADRSTDGGVAGERNAAFIAAANPATALDLIALARRAAGADTVAIPLVSGEELLARAAQQDGGDLPPLPPYPTPGRFTNWWTMAEEKVILAYARAAIATQPVHQPAPVQTIGKHRPFELAVKSIRLDWTIGGVHRLIDVVDEYVAKQVAPTPDASMQPFQQRVQPWMMACFGTEISADTKERNHRFFEESTELVQAHGMTASEAHQLVDYVYGRPVGEPAQEVGGVMVTLAALCLANGLDMHQAAEVELARSWTKVGAIRAKQAAKPKHSPLPQAVRPASERDAALLEQAAQACDQQADGTNGPYRTACLQCANAVRELRDSAAAKGGE